MEPSINSVYGNNVLIVGDMHLSDVYTGRHKNYLQNCFKCLGDVERNVKDTQPCAVVFLGDLVGVNEGNIRNREVLNMICKSFKTMNSVCPVYSVRGNHDFRGNFPEFQFLSELGLIHTADECGGYIDYYGFKEEEEPEVRFHLVDYGKESKELAIKGGNCADIVLAHNNFTIQGLTTWYNEHDGIELSMQSNFDGVYMVISGHIHNPSPEIISTDMVSGGTCSLFYPGCPTRPSYEKNLYKSAWFVRFTYNAENKTTDYNAEEFKLAPIEEVFFTDANYVEDKTEEQIAETERNDALKDVLDDIIKCRMTSGDIVKQVMCIPNASDEAKQMAASYLQMALDSKAV